jgi:hypothetical protein
MVEKEPTKGGTPRLGKELTHHQKRRPGRAYGMKNQNQSVKILPPRVFFRTPVDFIDRFLNSTGQYSFRPDFSIYERNSVTSGSID